MLPKALDELALEIEAGCEASTRLQRALSPSEKEVSRAHQLELITRVLDHACKSNSDATENAFRIALHSLRALVPFLKKKTASTIDTIAAVEKYAVNFAVSALSQEAKQPTSSYSEDELSVSLRRIFVARAEESTETTGTKRAARRKNPRQKKQDKENENPDRNLAESIVLDNELIDRLFFPQAATTLGLYMLLPNKDSVDVANAVAGALSIRFTRCCRETDLDDIVTLAEKLVIPWLNYVRTFNDATSQRTFDAYLRRVSSFLFDLCRLPQKDPAAVLHTRVFALQLEDPKLNQFATDLLQSVKNFLRSAKHERQSQHVQNTIISVYEDSLRYASKYDRSDVRWMSEDVSAWLDSVATVWARQKPRRPIPNVFLLRTSAFRDRPNMNMLSECFQLQNDLYNIGAYELDAETVHSQDSRLLNQTLWKDVASVVKSFGLQELLRFEERTPFVSYSTQFIDGWRVAEADALMCLRAIRTLEPLRRYISAASPKTSLPKGSELVLHLYLGAFFRGLSVLSFPEVSADTDSSPAMDDLLLRLNKSVGGAVEATRDLICSYTQEHMFDRVEKVSFAAAKILQHHERYCPHSSSRWKEWLFCSIASACKNTLRELSEIQSADVWIPRLSKTLVFCADQLLNCNNRVQSFSQGYWTLQVMLRDALLSRRCWWEATEISLRLFNQVTLSGTKDPTIAVLSEAGRMVVQDVVRLARHGHTLTFFKDVDISVHKLSSAIIEYSWWAQKNRALFKTSLKYFETTDGLVAVRRALFQFCDTSGLRCTVRRTHEKWLGFMNSLSYQITGRTEKIWKAIKLKTCPGHYSLGLAGPSTGELACTNGHFQFLECLRKACDATILGSFENVSQFLNRMESMLSVNNQLVTHLEFVMIAVEALQWISTLLAFNGFKVPAGRALSLVDQCASFLNIPTTASETRKIFGLLECLPKLHARQFEQKMIDDGKTLHKEGNLWSLNGSRAMQVAISNLKHALKTLWKYRLGSNEDDPHSCFVGGLSVDVSFNVWSICGQHRLSLVLEVVRCLFLLGTAQMDIESLSDARYYLERCLEISIACFPARNNSFRSISSISRAICMTRLDSRVAVQELILKQAPIEKEDAQDGSHIHANFFTLQTVADAMLYVEMTWKLESETSASASWDWDTDAAHVDIAKAMYERCQKMLEDERLGVKLSCDLDTERARLALNLGLTYLLKGNETAAVKLIKPLSKGENLKEGDIRAAASYQDARLSIYRAGGLRTCLSESSDRSIPNKDIPSRRRSRRRPRTKQDKQHTPMDETRATLSQAIQTLVPSLGNYPLFRKVWKLAAMLESEPEKMAWRLEKTVGLSFNARYEHNMKSKRTNETEHVISEKVSRTIGDVEKKLLELNFEDTEGSNNQSCATELLEMLTNRYSILAGIHIDEDKTSIVVWRRCAFGFFLKRAWLPSSGSQSYDGVLQRIESILCEMKQSSIKDGEEMSKEDKISWWEHRYRLDHEMRMVLTEVQQVWLGPVVNLLIPSIIADFDHTTPTQRDFESYIELGERACDTADVTVALGHLTLLVDKPSERIPWESLPLLREHEISATRTPSVSFLVSTWNPERKLDPRGIFYVVNPDGNLRRTEDRFREMLLSHRWAGITGKTSSELVAASYTGEEIYLYCGHGAGEDYFSPSKLCVQASAPIALLMGCSSCRPQEINIGDFESNGPAIDFLIHGSRAVVGNLWDVSDGEIDRLTSSVLSLWLGDDEEEVDTKPVSLADAVAQSRSKCRLPYLVGAACVVMGVPDIFVQRHVRN